MKKGKKEGKEKRGRERKKERKEGKEITIQMGGMHRLKVRSKIVISERVFG